MVLNKLAIIIPAYKETFLEQALESIASQTCQDFTVYIGDDCSPYDLSRIILRYEKRINLNYKRFDDNLGGRDLVAQWERCIALCKDEEWIWLFSDDDLMSPSCVEEFYKHLNIGAISNFDIVHYNVNIIDEDNKVLLDHKMNAFPKVIDTFSFYKQRLSGKIPSFVVEYIYRKSSFVAKGGFQNFDLAWSSDVATCIKLSGEKGIYTLEGGNVSWRRSNENISPTLNIDIAPRKMDAIVEFFGWSNTYFGDKQLTSFNAFIMFKRLKMLKGFLSKEKRISCIDQFSQSTECPTVVSLFLKTCNLLMR